MKKIIFGACILCACQSANAQRALDSVIIHENRIQEYYGKQNRNIEILSSKQIAALPVKSTNELLSYISGVDLRQRGPNGTQADISIDGGTFDEVLVLINGVKMSDPQTGHHALNIPIPLTAIDHIEILRGPAAMIYGVNALTGAVNIVTRVLQHNEVSAQLYAGSSMKSDTTGDTYYNWGAQASASLTGKSQQHDLSLAHNEGNGYRYNTAYKDTRAFYQGNIAVGKTNNLDVMGGYIYNDFGANGFYAAPADAESKETVQTALGSIAYAMHPTQKLMIKPRISYRYNKDDYIFIRQNPDYYHNIHETNVVTGEVQSSYTTERSITGAGIEYRNEDIHSTNLGQRQRANIGLYAQYKHYFSDKLNAGAGIYGNYNSDYGWQAFPGIDVGYKPAAKWKIFANASTGQRLPTYTDLYYKGPTNIGNAALRPELAQYAEAGVQYQSAYFSVKGSYFDRHLTDFIDWIRANENAPWQPQNFQSINTQGITANIDYMLSRHLGMSDNIVMNVTIGYTYLKPGIILPTAEISKYAIEALKHQAIVSLRTMVVKSWEINLNARYQYRINANDYTLLDARLAYHFSHWRVYADVNNILDTQYKEIGSIPLPGRWYTVGAQLNFSY